VLVAQLRHLKDPGTIADDLLDRFSLTDAATRRVSTYSGGMRRRLDSAMSLIGNPPVIFLDEPTTGLDPQARIEVWNSVKELSEHGTTVLLTTQYLDEAEQLASGMTHRGTVLSPFPTAAKAPRSFVEGPSARAAVGGQVVVVTTLIRRGPEASGPAMAPRPHRPLRPAAPGRRPAGVPRSAGRWAGRPE
jgi:ABC-type Na+ transport system ATPase subunit NatA